MNTGLNIPILNNAYHTASVYGWQWQALDWLWPKSDSSFNVFIQGERFLIREPWTLKIPGLSSNIALHSPLQKCKVSLFHLLTMADSGAVYMERMTSHHDMFSMPCWLCQISYNFLRFLVIVFYAALTTSSLWINVLYLFFFELLSHTLPVSSNC